MGEVSLDDIQLALVPVSKKSASVYKSVVILYKSIFRAAMESRIIDHNPTIYLTTKGGGVPQEDRQALTDEQVERLLDAIRDLPEGVKTLPISAWEKEYTALKAQREAEYDTLKETRAEVAELQKIRKCVDIALRADQPEQTQSRTKRHDIDR